MLWELTHWRRQTKGRERPGERREKQMHGNSVFLHFPEPHLILCDISYSSDFITLGTSPHSLLHEMQSVTTTKLSAFLPKMETQKSVWFFHSL